MSQKCVNFIQRCNNDSQVIIYGHNKDKELLKSSYIALALIANGFSNVSILDGGYGDWKYEFEQEKGMISTKNTQFSKGNFTGKFNPDDTLKSNEKLDAIFTKELKLNPNKEVIAYCTGGLEASMNWYLLTQHLNFKDVKIYDASLKEWGNIDSTPMSK